jgi:hypothetical protein
LLYRQAIASQRLDLQKRSDKFRMPLSFGI